MPDRLEADRAQAIADAVAALPAVAGLSGGRFGEIALLYPRRRVIGLREADRGARLEIHVRLHVDVADPRPLQGPLDAVRDAAIRALGPDAAGRTVDVVLDDVVQA
ncbi:hypothetical protein [Corynebacterium sp.]|uniref:hypothetical protein n=1 Tax=Corynebacterium sp. TaxID=1720 RepID=UPI0026DBF71B|nr:hypothetical protein [Corynebacterium sp.]MDO4609962.1 hypothetical protein [Corynebacterium sp.]